jgi:hypothetical protein
MSIPLCIPSKKVSRHIYADRMLPKLNDILAAADTSYTIISSSRAYPSVFSMTVPLVLRISLSLANKSCSC